MDSQAVIRWIMSWCLGVLRRSQAKTLSELVAAAMTMDRTSLAALGRSLSRLRPVAVKHCIKRVDRFVGNPRIEPTTTMQPVIKWLARPRERLLVSLDWVDIRHLHCLVLAAHLRGRALPLLWAVYRWEQLHRSQNNIEYGLLHLLRTMVPSSTKIVVLADRGFGRTEMARTCQKLGFGYILRISPDVYIQHPDFRGKLLDLPVRRGQCRILRHVAYRKERPVTQSVAVLWPAEQDQPWFLVTNLPRLQPRRLSRIYGHRMTIEEYFRDMKSKRNGFALRLSLVKSPRRLERLLLILALAYWLLTAIGRHASKCYRPGCWCSTNRLGQCSFFTIGRIMFEKMPLRLQTIMPALRKELLCQNWG